MPAPITSLVPVEVAGRRARTSARARSRRRAAPRAALARRQGHARRSADLARVPALQLAHDREGDLRGAAEHARITPCRRAGAAGGSSLGASHESQASREIRAQHTRRGRRARAGRGSGRARGYMASQSCSRRRRASFVRYTRPPQPATISSSSSSAARSPGAAAGRSTASVQPSSGNDSGPPNAGPKRLNTARYTGSRRVRISSKQRSSAASWPVGDHELVLDQPGRSVQPVPLAERVEREEVRRHRQRAPALAARRGAPAQRVERAQLAGRSSAAGKPRGTSNAGRRESAPGYGGPPLARLAGVRAARRRQRIGAADDRSAHARSVGEQVEPRDRVAVALVAAHQLERLLQAVGAVDVRGHPRRGERLRAQRRLDDRRPSGPSRRASRRTARGRSRARPRRHRRPACRARAPPRACAKPPSRWWFLPWMSLAIAPASVTCRVPGTTGSVSSCAARRAISCATVAPACAVISPLLAVDRQDPVQRGHVEHVPAAVLSGVAVAASSAASYHAPLLAGIRCEHVRRRPAARTVERRGSGCGRSFPSRIASARRPPTVGARSAQ